MASYSGGFLRSDSGALVVDAPTPQDEWNPGLVETMPRHAAVTNNGSLVSGRLHLAGGGVIKAGQTISSITFVSGTTAATSPTNQWFCLVRSSDNTILGKTADDTTTAWGTSAAKTLSLASSHTATEDTPVYLGIVVVASTVPTLVAANLNATGTVILSPRLAATANTGLTNPASLTSVGTLSGTSVLPYAYAS